MYTKYAEAIQMATELDEKGEGEEDVVADLPTKSAPAAPAASSETLGARRASRMSVRNTAVFVGKGDGRGATRSSTIGKKIVREEQDGIVRSIEKTAMEKVSIETLLKESNDAFLKKMYEQVQSHIEVVINALEMKTIEEGKEFDQKTADEIYLVATGTFEQLGSPGKTVTEGGLLGPWLDGNSYKAKKECRVWAIDKASFQILTRGRKFEEFEDAEEKKDEKKAEESKDAPASLADKIAADFKSKEHLFGVDASLRPSNAVFAALGRVVPDQHFTHPKPVYVVGDAPTKTAESKREDDEMQKSKDYLIEATSNLSAHTYVHTVCEKGAKAKETSTPNQDNFAIVHFTGGSLYSVFDGHGPFGHIVSLKLVQYVPHFLLTDPDLLKKPKEAIIRAFRKAEDKLEEFAKQENMNIHVSGASGSVVLQYDRHLLIAWIGDSRVITMNYGRNSEKLTFESTDHVPQLPEEKKRIENHDPPGEVREVSPDYWRIYLPGQPVPGLTMSRCFGDISCADRGLIVEPEFQEIELGDEPLCAIVASDGIWEFLDGAFVLEKYVKKLRLKGPLETNRLLVDSARKRWKAYEGDICDDITSIIIQFNVRSKGDESPASIFMTFQDLLADN
jgi:serine/threonine protein phosphatase PrpC